MNPSIRDRRTQHAFTRLECLAVFFSLVLLGVVTLPLLATGSRSAEVSVCSNNLRQLGQAMHLWAQAIGTDQMPWRVLQTDGGTMPQTGLKPAQAWAEFYALRTVLTSPKLLVCPSDLIKRVAKDWSNVPDGGFLNANYQNKAISYFVGLDVFEEFSFSPLSGDRNLKRDSQSGCSSRVSAASAFYTFPRGTPRPYWTNGIHGLVGNVLFNDGQVELTTNNRFREIILGDEYDNGQIHFIIP